MIHRTSRFNLYLLVMMVLTIVGAGCSSLDKKKEKLEQSSLRLHLEVNGNQGTNVLIGTTSPFQLTVDRTPFLSEFNMEWAKVVDVIGGFSIAIQFNDQGTILLEQYTTAYRGRHVGIFAEFGQLRWIAAPVMQNRIVNGQLVFTPDTTREEANRIVRGLNRVADLVRKGRK